MKNTDHHNHDSKIINTNHTIAGLLLEASNILRKKGANPYRIRAYRSAAKTLDKLDKNVVDIINKEDVNGLIKLPYIGKNIAYAIYEYFVTGKWDFLESLRNSLRPPDVFTLIPGVGPKLAEQIYSTLHVNSLEELELAANAGKLIEIPGVGDRRQRMIIETLHSILHDPQAQYHIQQDGPNVGLLLKIDKLYLKKAKEGSLKTIAPKRYNPAGTAWLPILQHKDKGWQFRAMYSNTERAHRLHKSSDWVIIHAYNNAHHEFHRTIVTETRGPLKGKRVVRGYEDECLEFYKSMNIT